MYTYAFIDKWIRTSTLLWPAFRKPLNQELSFPGGSTGKQSGCNAGDLGLIPGLGRSPGEGKVDSGLENSMDCIVHGVTKSRTRLSNFHFHLTKNREMYHCSCSTLCVCCSKIYYKHKNV